MSKALAMLVAVVTLLAALADIASFVIANGGFITRAVVEVAARAKPAAASTRAPCRKTAVIRLDPECSQVSDPQRRADCLRAPPPQMEICVETVQSR